MSLDAFVLGVAQPRAGPGGRLAAGAAGRLGCALCPAHHITSAVGRASCRIPGSPLNPVGSVARGAGGTASHIACCFLGFLHFCGSGVGRRSRCLHGLFVGGASLVSGCAGSALHLLACRERKGSAGQRDVCYLVRHEEDSAHANLCFDRLLP